MSFSFCSPPNDGNFIEVQGNSHVLMEVACDLSQKFGDYFVMNLVIITLIVFDEEFVI